MGGERKYHDTAQRQNGNHIGDLDKRCFLRVLHLGSIDAVRGCSRACLLFHLGLTLGLGVVVFDEDAYRSHLAAELLPAVRFDWFRVELGIGLTVEPPIAATLRPGVRFYLGPVYLRPTFQLLLHPVVTWGALFGFGGEVPLAAGWSFCAEVDAGFWYADTVSVPVEGRLGVSYAF